MFYLFLSRSILFFSICNLVLGLGFWIRWESVYKDVMKQARVFASYVIYLVCAKYIVLSRYVLDVRLVLFREVRLCRKVVLCRKYILFG